MGDEGSLRSVKKIERLPASGELSWCIENAPLTHLSELPPAKHVKSLYLVECRKLTSFSGIVERFPKLKTLWAYSCDRLITLDGLQSLKELQALTIWPSFSGRLAVDTLAPLAGAIALRTLVFSGKINDGSLTPLYGLGLLRRAFVPNNLPWDEFARFEAHRPDVAFPWKGGVVYDANPATLVCPSCGRAQAMPTGKGIKLCCPHCEGERLTKHIRRYAEVSQKS